MKPLQEVSKDIPKLQLLLTLARIQYHKWLLGFWVLGSNPMVGIPNDLKILLIRG
jgi:hypothetical protein